MIEMEVPQHAMEKTIRKVILDSIIRNMMYNTWGFCKPVLPICHPTHVY